MKKQETIKLGESPIGDNLKGIQQNLNTLSTGNASLNTENIKLSPSTIRSFEECTKPPLPNNKTAEERWPHLGVITDIGTTITDLKGGLLDYYGTLFIPSEHDIGAKIESLRTKDTIHGNYNSEIKNSINNKIQVTKNKHGFDVFHKVNEAPLLDDIPDPYSAVPKSIYSYRDKKGNQISDKVSIDDSELIDFHGLAELPGRGTLRMAANSKNTGRNPNIKNKKYLDEISIEGNYVENLLGFDLKDLAARGALSSRARIPYNDIGEMMECISRNCKDVQNRLTFFEDSLSSYQSDPKMAQFIPPLNEPRRLIKNYQSKDPIASYIYSLYRDLYNKSEINSKRIEVIKAKLKVLQSHSKPKTVRIAAHSSLGL
ncbi:hypothetical protein FG386_000801 [Cryptosporidium ryanae]|uniref:uncharacterized protein n=1 Tax=Cryptosporidium ryanae TaxID=515981 RepID=UPI00351AA558|nr:hypothetical protein FG386_000801 [Cryptosporidium ryanae]